MQSLIRAASSVTNSIISRRNAPEPVDVRERQLEGYQYAYRLVSSLVDDLGETVCELPPDLINLHREAERILRRFNICHPSHQDDFRGDLAWMQNFGNEVDLKVIQTMEGRLTYLFPECAQRIQDAVESIEERLGEVAKRGGFIKTSPLLLSVCGAISLIVGVAMRHFVAEPVIMFVLGLAGGIGSSVFLFREGFRRTRNQVARVCFVAAGILMIIETAGLLTMRSLR